MIKTPIGEHIRGHEPHVDNIVADGTDFVRADADYELGRVHPGVPRTRPPVYACDYSDELVAVDSRGHVPVPTGPGRGTPLDWTYMERQRTDQNIYD